MSHTPLPFTFLDVFTETPFKGNPLAVVTIPIGVTLTQAQKQAIAREFNLSETVFVHDVESPETSTERRFDIFTPLTELPFAGHPTIGTAVFLYPRGVRTLHAKTGPIDIQTASNGALRAAIPHNVRLHERRLPGLEQPSAVSRSRLEIAVAEAERGAPLFSIVKGMTFALVELPSLELLGAVRVGAMPDLPADLLDDAWREGWATRRYYFVRLGSERIGGKTIHKIRTRMVNQRVEDPATGSAACALSSYLSLHVLDEASMTFEITQGVEMGRDSNIVIDVEVSQDTGERTLGSLHLGGKAIPVMSGCITSRP
ncbi:Diaminopimelate epimerase-like protein [Aspergillus steynii IBT 23096]|uniref:Diaminopimelate epimerase-like protein n=1 Tax=Aspergillus steynii IBT 23096 TaxID=1392250 RepID=A0A2I2GPR3_9EURO|nr:Diaminopimelate epimerase-like protein [Aspergillus steynii IBT 23096]PLB54859.1 Diaminopimelate epimerase-like protein [Aspergillus steynii IBT 23096]